LVDTVAGTGKLLTEYREMFAQFTRRQKKLEELVDKSTKERADLDYWQFQFNQLDEAGLQENEQDVLEAELGQLTHAEEIKSAFAEVQQLLDDERFSVIQHLKESHKKLESIQNYVADVPELTQRLQSSLLELKDILDETQRLAESVEHDPERIDLVNDRLN